MESVAFMFAGQGAQYAGMGAQTAAASNEAAEIFAKADKILGWSVSEKCFRGTLEELTPCAVCQPAIYTVSMAFMAAYTASTPDIQVEACGGLSLGEISAACAAGVFSFEDGLRLVAERGRLMDKCCADYPGGMAAVLGCDENIVREVCGTADIDVANYNCPGQIVISGTVSGLEKAMADLESRGFRAVRLNVAGAYHSRLMEPAAEAFGAVLDSCTFSSPNRIFVQNVAGIRISDPAEIKANLQKQISGSVRWESCARCLMENASRLVELGPGSVLSGFMRRINRKFPAAPGVTEQI